MRLLEGKNAVITGARKGMGLATMKLFAENGANVFALIRGEDDAWLEKAEKIASENGVEIFPIYADLRDEVQIKAAVKEIMSKKMPINILVNNAGISVTALYLMTSNTTVREQFDVNFFAPFLFTQSVVKLMQRAGRGNIINISSTAGQDGNPGKSAYGASKAALITLTKVIAREHGKDKIRCNAIAPGVIETEMLGTMPEATVAEEIANQDIGKVGAPEEVAKVSLFLASDLSSYITGEVIRVDGGMH